MNVRHVRCLGSCLLLLVSLTGLARAGGSMTISSPAFDSGQPIPAKHALASGNLSPELELEGVPANAKSFVLIVDDPDAPAGLWTHWLVWNVPAATTSISEGKLPPDAREGENSFGHVRYDGPAPPSGTHRYYFHIYALDTKLSLPAGASRAALMEAIHGHVLGTGEFFGTYRAAL
jgi:Raf kinase inhibitor-like YbhB/YbcL family protein